MNPVTETVTGHGSRVTSKSHGSLARATGHWQEPRVTSKSHRSLARATGHEQELQVTSTKGRSVEA